MEFSVLRSSGWGSNLVIVCDQGFVVIQVKQSVKKITTYDTMRI